MIGITKKVIVRRILYRVEKRDKCLIRSCRFTTLKAVTLMARRRYAASTQALLMTRKALIMMKSSEISVYSASAFTPNPRKGGIPPRFRSLQKIMNASLGLVTDRNARSEIVVRLLSLQCLITGTRLAA